MKEAFLEFKINEAERKMKTEQENAKKPEVIVREPTSEYIEFPKEAPMLYQKSKKKVKDITIPLLHTAPKMTEVPPSISEKYGVNLNPKSNKKKEKKWKFNPPGKKVKKN